MRSRIGSFVVAGVAVACLSAGQVVLAQGVTSFNLPAQSLAESLRAVAGQTNSNILFDRSLVEGLVAKELKAELSVEEALRQLLAGTGLSYRHADHKTVMIVVGERSSALREERGAVRVAQGAAYSDELGEGSKEGGVKGGDRDSTVSSKNKGAREAEDANQEEDSEIGGIPEILVTGSKVGSLNIDIKRTQNDVQPYIVFDRASIERSGSTSLDEFLKNNLTMNVVALSNNQSTFTSNKSKVSLRGLGSDETLILIDGRRTAAVVNNTNGSLTQSDLNGIPLAAIERIEVLPTTASGIYGGSATGGVINVVLRHDYSGTVAKVAYGNTFESDVANRRIDFSSSFNLRDGRTNILLSASYADANPFLVAERDLNRRAREHILTNNPAFFFGGVPPQGAVPNIRSNVVVNGVRQDLVLDDGTPLNSAITFITPGYPGTADDGGAALISNAGQYNLDLPSTAATGGGSAGLLSNSEAKSFMVTLRQDLTSRFQAFFEVQASKNVSKFPSNTGWFANGGANVAVISADAPNNPFQQSIQVSVPAVGLDSDIVTNLESHRAVAGLIFDLREAWRASLDVTWSQSRSAYTVPAAVSSDTLAAIANGSVDVLRDLRMFPVTLETNPFPFAASSPADASLTDVSFRLAGLLPWAASAGNPSLSLLVEHRKESLHDSVRSNGSVQSLVPNRFQSVKSVYIESKIPLVSTRNRVPGIESLEFQLAARRDDYSVTGATSDINLANPRPITRFTRDDSSIDPTVGLRYQPIQHLVIRASYGAGYLPPSVAQIVPGQPFPLNAGSLADPARGNEPLRTVTVLSGGNPNLDPEKSESWSAGMIITPSWIPGLRLSADWSDIKKKDNITALGFTQTTLNEYIANFPERITRDTSAGGSPVGPITGLDFTLLNVSKMRSKAFDVALSYETSLARFGIVDLSIATTRMMSLETQITASSSTVENAGVIATGDSPGGLKWVGNASLRWVYGQWSLGWRTRFFDSYFLNAAHTVAANQGSATVPSQIYHDLYGSYRFAYPTSVMSAVLNDLEIQFGINNVFSRLPPIDVSSTSYSPFGDPRLANYYVSVRKEFGN